MSFEMFLFGFWMIIFIQNPNFHKKLVRILVIQAFLLVTKNSVLSPRILKPERPKSEPPFVLILALSRFGTFKFRHSAVQLMSKFRTGLVLGTLGCWYLDQSVVLIPSCVKKHKVFNFNFGCKKCLGVTSPFTTMYFTYLTHVV